MTRGGEGERWIAGGLPKEGGIEPLREFFPRIRKAYLIGAAAAEFARTLTRGNVAHVTLNRPQALNALNSQVLDDLIAAGRSFDAKNAGYFDAAVAKSLTLGGTVALPKAEAAFRRALELKPDSALTLNYLGYMLADQNMKLQESVELLKQAVEPL